MSDRYGREFPRPNPVNFECRICHTRADAPVYLVPIPGTAKDGLVECEQLHVACVDLLEAMNQMPQVGP